MVRVDGRGCGRDEQKRFDEKSFFFSCRKSSEDREESQSVHHVHVICPPPQKKECRGSYRKLCLRRALLPRGHVLALIVVLRVACRLLEKMAETLCARRVVTSLSLGQSEQNPKSLT